MAACDKIVLCKAALVFSVTRWVLSFALNLFNRLSNYVLQNTAAAVSSSSSRCPSSSSNLRILRNSLSLTALGNMEHRLPENGELISCAICLNRLRKSSQVWELSNCCHVFHKNCLEKWLCYDSRFSCPLCRVTLLSSAAPPGPQSSPGWAVEKMLYLFGYDLLP